MNNQLEVLRNKIKNEIGKPRMSSSYYGGYKQALIEVENMIMDMLSQLPQQEISDEEIEKGAMETMDYVYLNPNDSLIFHQGWMRAIKWYREQLKNIDKIVKSF